MSSSRASNIRSGSLHPSVCLSVSLPLSLSVCCAYFSLLSSQFIMVTHDSQHHTRAFFGWRHRTHTHTHACGRGRSEMYPLHLSHPRLSFLKDPPGAVGSFAAPRDQVK